MPKKEDIFFTMLKQVAAQLLDASVEYASIMREYPESITRIPRMKVHETTTDELVADIHKQLYTSFITPIEREDISDLALRMDGSGEIHRVPGGGRVGARKSWGLVIFPKKGRRFFR